MERTDRKIWSSSWAPASGKQKGSRGAQCQDASPSVPLHFYSWPLSILKTCQVPFTFPLTFVVVTNALHHNARFLLSIWLGPWHHLSAAPSCLCWGQHSSGPLLLAVCFLLIMAHNGTKRVCSSPSFCENTRGTGSRCLYPQLLQQCLGHGRNSLSTC